MTIEAQISEPNVEPGTATDADLFETVFSGEDYLPLDDNPSTVDMNQVLDGLVEIGQDDEDKPAETEAEPKSKAEKPTEEVAEPGEDEGEDEEVSDEEKDKPDEKKDEKKDEEDAEKAKAKAKADAEDRRRMKAVEHREREFLSKAEAQKKELAAQLSLLDEKQAKIEQYVEKTRAERAASERLRSTDPLRFVEQELGVPFEVIAAMHMEREGHEVPPVLRGELNKFRSDPKRQERGLTREDIAEEIAKALEVKNQAREQLTLEQRQQAEQREQQEVAQRNVDLAIGVVNHFAGEYPLIRGLIKTPDSLMSHMMAARKSIYEETGHDGSPKECADYIENKLSEGVRSSGYQRQASPTGADSGTQPPQGKRNEASTLTNRTASDRITHTNHDDMESVYASVWSEYGVG